MIKMPPMICTGVMVSPSRGIAINETNTGVNEKTMVTYDAEAFL